MCNKDLKEDIRRIIEAEEEINYQRRMGQQWVNDLKPVGTDWNKPYLTEAPYIVLLFKQSYGINKDRSKKMHYNKILCSISCGEHLLKHTEINLMQT